MNSALLERLNWIEEQIDLLSTRIAAAPEGHLQAGIEHGIPRYYMTIPGVPGRRYLGAGSEELIQRLAQKDYDQKALALLQQEHKALSRLFDKQADAKLERLFEGMHDAKKGLVRPLVLSPEDYAKQWQDQPFRQKNIDESLAFSTQRGDLVRSKSEVIIADALYSAGIPYRYECLVGIKGAGDFYPDFTVLNTRTRKVYLWEHFGMMDNPQYFSNAMSKLGKYEANGYIEGKNLIITMEGQASAFDTRTISTKINAFLR